MSQDISNDGAENEQESEHNSHYSHHKGGPENGAAAASNTGATASDLQPGNVELQRHHGDVVAETPEGFTGLKLLPQHHKAAGFPGVLRSLQMAWGMAGPFRSSYALLQLNQKDGIDCMSCAWPEPDGKRKIAEFCESGAKAVAHEMDKRRCGPEFFAQHSVAELSRRSDYWLEQQGRLTTPMILRDGDTHYRPISWEEAFAFIGSELKGLESPNEAVFYTSGRASNEAAFTYQLFVRMFGTNNLPDCSNMCHESSGSALSPTIGIGKGTVTIEDFLKAEAIFILGQNPGTNHPRMLTTLEEAKHAGAKIVAINPMKEAGLMGFMNPQQVGGMLGMATPIADQYLQIKINGDVAVLKGIMKEMLEAEDRAPGTVLDWTFINEKTAGVEQLIADVRSADWAEIIEDSGVTRQQIKQAAELAMRSERIIVCWAMGLTQHHNAVETIQEVVNLVLLRGSIGKPGAGLCPVRGHSNVQGDRTMGIWERPRKELLDRLQENFAFAPPREFGLDVVDSIKAMHSGKVKIFIQLGGNFLSATPDTLLVQEALSRLELQVRIGTKLNRSDLVTGRQAIILPCLGRTEIDEWGGGKQFVTTENSMGVVESSHGRFTPASPELLSEVAIICGMAKASVGNTPGVNWDNYASNYDVIRDDIARTIAGCEDYNAKVRHKGGFYLPNKARDNEYVTKTKKANFTVNPIPKRDLQPGQLVMMTIRSHDQFNTTVYGLHDRYRGVHNERRVLFMNAQDMADRKLQTRQVVNITSHFNGHVRNAKHFVVVPYNLPRGNCATYFPEGNSLIPIASVAARSNTPVSKYVAVTVQAAGESVAFDYSKAADSQ